MRLLFAEEKLYTGSPTKDGWSQGRHNLRCAGKLRKCSLFVFARARVCVCVCVCVWGGGGGGGGGGVNGASFPSQVGVIKGMAIILKSKDTF